MAKKSKTAPAPKPAAPVQRGTLSPEMAQQITRLVDQRIGQVLLAVAQHAVQQRAGAQAGPMGPRPGMPGPIVDPRAALVARLRGGR